MSNTQNPNCNCPDLSFVPLKGLRIEGIEVALDPNSFPGGSGVEPGPDNTHLVSRDGSLAWDPIAPGGDGVNYSTEEQWTGKLWTDGKKLYQKTVFTEGLVNKGTKFFPHDITAIEDVVACSGMMKASYGYLPLPRAHADEFPIQVTITKTEVLLKTFSARADQEYPLAKVWLTILYTCTDR